MNRDERKLNFALIGCGRIAQRHAGHIANVGKLVAVCDVEHDRAVQLANQYDDLATTYSDVTSMLEAEQDKIDVIAVCSPNGLHAAHAIQSLEAGFHVLCEKPMAISVLDCGEMIKAAERANRRLFGECPDNCVNAP
jgi:UDP-N-acetyl-2-amino-2-deoxyglucuronate dehydrogenase